MARGKSGNQRPAAKKPAAKKPAAKKPAAKKPAAKKPAAAKLSTAALARELAKAARPLGGKLEAVRDADDTVVLSFDGAPIHVFLDNARRRIASGEPVDEVMGAFAASLRPAGPSDAPALIAGLRTMIEQRAIVPPELLQRPLSRELVLCLVWTDPDEAVIRFVSPALLAEQGVTIDAAWKHAGAGMDALLAMAPLEVGSDGELGMLPIDSAFKASLVAAPSLRAAVEPSLGWPVRAVVPCRDFVFVFPKRSDALLPKLAPIVVRELEGSPYPLSAEVLEISDAGIVAIGTFRAP